MSSPQRWLLFWGVVLIWLALCFLLRALEVTRDVLGVFWPGFLLLAGAGLLISALVPARPVVGEETITVDLQGARQVSVDIEHGGGPIEVTSGASPGAALTASRGIGMKASSHLEGDRLAVKVECGLSFLPVLGPESGVWRLRLTDEVPLTLSMESVASQIMLDLQNLPVTYCKLEAGASSITLIPPARMANALLDVEAGVAVLSVRIPEGIAARIRLEDGLTARTIDPNRFLPVARGLYQSPNYDQAAHRVELQLGGGIGSVHIH
ncbi:MAG: hypothetical protein RML46_02395 [Anaerolineae bacterium]|nr:hypothetical protein [Anaerolineae bacterium]MDW8067746.1 hypothetical protein [Anaerolineae bacterium]